VTQLTTAKSHGNIMWLNLNYSESLMHFSFYLALQNDMKKLLIWKHLRDRHVKEAPRGIRMVNGAFYPSSLHNISKHLHKG
jgi:hypothetical protein